MSIEKNKFPRIRFKRHYLGSVLFKALSIVIFFLASRLFDNVSEDVKQLFINNGKYFTTFLIISVVVYTSTSILYSRTLGYFEEETKETIQVSIITVFLWTIIWTSWSIFCGWLTLFYKPQTFLVKLTIWLLVVVPSLFAFIISYFIRKQQIKQENKYKKLAEPFTICLDKKFYSGYYALICVPVYLLMLIFFRYF